MEKSIIKMTYRAEKENGVLSHNVKCEADEKYVEVISMLCKSIGYKKVSNLEDIVFGLINGYEERAYIEGFKNGFNLSNEIKAHN